MKEELKPCPFCGGEAAYGHRSDESLVFCRRCGAEATSFGTSNLAAKFWNTRPAIHDAAPDLLEALKWCVENDETNTGDVPLEDHGGRTWNEINEYWIDGLNRANSAIAKAEGQK